MGAQQCPVVKVARLPHVPTHGLDAPHGSTFRGRPLPLLTARPSAGVVAASAVCVIVRLGVCKHAQTANMGGLRQLLPAAAASGRAGQASDSQPHPGDRLGASRALGSTR
jgi:hypothetical protein